MFYDYRPSGVCAMLIRVEMDGDIVKDVQIVGGCPGNHLGIIELVKGMKADEVIKRLTGIRCGNRPTSCPDQLAKAIEAAMAEK